MALRLLKLNVNLTKYAVKTLTGVSHNVTGITPLLKSNTIYQCPQRPNTFFTKISAEQLWKSVVSVSNAGKRRGRGKRGSKKLAKNLNKGQLFGVGKTKIVWPGLNVPILQGSQLMKHHKLPEDSDTFQNANQDTTVNMGRPKRTKVHPLERGWTSATMNGRSIGPPNPVAYQKFENFDTKVLELKIVNTMTSNMGRRRRYSCFAITGNKNGLAGFALKKANDGKSAVEAVKNRTGKKIMYINRYKDHTVYHDFFTEFGRTKIFVEQKPEGFGLRCHRVIKECCEMIGIKNLRAKVEGAINTQNITKAFFLGLLNQRTHEQLAEEKQLHLVELKNENDYYPEVVASPTKVRTKNEISPDEIIDFSQYIMNGMVVLKRLKREKDTKCFPLVNRQRKMEFTRNQEKVKLRMYMEHGKLHSILSDKYPDAVPCFWNKNWKELAESSESNS